MFGSRWPLHVCVCAVVRHAEVPSPPPPGRSCLFPFEDGFLDDGHGDPSLTPALNSPTRCQNGERMERYSRKVFVGGLPPDIDEGEDTFVICWALLQLLPAAGTRMYSVYALYIIMHTHYDA